MRTKKRSVGPRWPARTSRGISTVGSRSASSWFPAGSSTSSVEPDRRARRADFEAGALTRFDRSVFENCGSMGAFSVRFKRNSVNFRPPIAKSRVCARIFRLRRRNPLLSGFCFVLHFRLVFASFESIETFSTEIEWQCCRSTGRGSAKQGRCGEPPAEQWSGPGREPAAHPHGDPGTHAARRNHGPGRGSRLPAVPPQAPVEVERF